MTPLTTVPPSALVTGWDFSTGSVKVLAFDLDGTVVAEARFPTELVTEGGVSELNLLQLEGQARATTRAVAGQLRELGRLGDWLAGGVSATHHTAGRIDALNNPVRRAICWNDQTLAQYHARGLERLGGPARVQDILGGPWAERYTLSHLVKDESTLAEADWRRTRWILPHASLAAGYLTGRFDCVSLSSAASTGLMNFAGGRWAYEMLDALERPEYRAMVRDQLPTILPEMAPVGELSRSLAIEARLPEGLLPVVFAPLDDQAAGLVGGGAVDAGQVAVILGNSAVVNSSSATPDAGTLDCMRLNWGPFLWMRCYTNGAQFLDSVVGPRPDWPELERLARQVEPGSGGVMVSPFLYSEPSLGVRAPQFAWHPGEPQDTGTKVRASFEALAYLVALGVEEHVAAGQRVTKVTASGGIARSELMFEILASVLNRPLERLASDEGPALGAAVAALAGLETLGRCQRGEPQPYTVADAVARMVRYRAPVSPNPAWVAAYAGGLSQFRARFLPSR